MTAGHVSESQSGDDPASQKHTTWLYRSFHILFSFFLLYTQVAKDLLLYCLNAETQDDEKSYEITLFSVCGDSIFAGKLQTEILV